MEKQNALTIKLLPITGPFAENKDIGKDIRVDKIEPALGKGIDIILDFNGIEGATQSFIHSMISQVIRDNGNAIIDRIFFKDCVDDVKAIISIVISYMQDSD